MFGMKNIRPKIALKLPDTAIIVIFECHKIG